MTEDELEQLRTMSWINRARLDVLERVIVDYLAFTNISLAAALEDNLRHAHERIGTAEFSDPVNAKKQQLANEAAVRLADLLAQNLAKKG